MALKALFPLNDPPTYIWMLHVLIRAYSVMRIPTVMRKVENPNDNQRGSTFQSIWYPRMIAAMLALPEEPDNKLQVHNRYREHPLSSMSNIRSW